MKLQIIKIENSFNIHPINKKIQELISRSPDLANKFLLLNGICCKDKGNEKLIIYKNNESEYGYYIDKTLNESFVFIIKNFISVSNLNVGIVFDILLLAQDIGLDQLQMYELFNILHWPSSKKGMDYLISMRSFSPELKELVINEKISLKEAYLFHEHFKKDYDAVFNILPSKLSFSVKNELIKHITEYSKKENKTLDEIIRELKRSDTKDIKKKVFELRYPYFSKYNMLFQKYLDEIKLPGGVKIDYDKTFEKQDYDLNIRYKDIHALNKKLKKLSESINDFIDKNDIDPFDHNQLFKKG